MEEVAETVAAAIRADKLVYLTDSQGRLSALVTTDADDGGPSRRHAKGGSG